MSRKKKTSCRRDDWDCICELPRTKKQRERCATLGWVDSYAIQGPPPREVPYGFERRKGGMGQHRSQIFTWTSKVHSPSWSLPAVGTCPGVCGIEKKALRTPENIPVKCVGCYAFQAGQYRNPDVKKATHRRYGWFDSKHEDDVVKDLVAAIKVAGREECRHKKATRSQPWVRGTDKKNQPVWSREDPVMCTRDPNGTPTRFRLFDSGDFHDARAVRIWSEVIARFPRTKFWAPTTAWVKHGVPGEKALMEELGKLAAMPNVSLKPSGLLLDKPAVHKAFNGTNTLGTTVLSWKKVKGKGQCPWMDKPHGTCERQLKLLPHATTLSGKPVVYDPNDDASIPEKILINKVEHYLCRGDCAKCQRCWDRNARVAYVQHGPDIADAKKFLRRSNEMLDYMNVLFPQFKDVGPEGATDHPATRFLTSRRFLDQYERTMQKRAETAAKKAAKQQAAVAGLDRSRWRRWA